MVSSHCAFLRSVSHHENNLNLMSSGENLPVILSLTLFYMLKSEFFLILVKQLHLYFSKNINKSARILAYIYAFTFFFLRDLLDCLFSQIVHTSKEKINQNFSSLPKVMC